MRYFVDTSALFALLNESDSSHDRATQIWERLREEEALLYATNYVLVETISLAQARLGIEAVRAFQLYFAPALSVIMINEEMHNRAVNVLMAHGERRLSLTDCSSFVACETNNLDTVFAFDKHFEREGFRLLTP